MNHNKAAGIVFLCGLVYQFIIVPIVHGVFGIDISNGDSSVIANVAGTAAIGALHTVEKMKGKKNGK